MLYAHNLLHAWNKVTFTLSAAQLASLFHLPYCTDSQDKQQLEQT